MHKYYVVPNNTAGLDHIGKLADIGQLRVLARCGGTRRAADALAQANAGWQSQFDQTGICYLVVQVAKNYCFGRVVAQFNS